MGEATVGGTENRRRKTMLRATAFPAPYIAVPVLTRSTTQTNTCQSLASTRVIHAHSSLVSCFEFQNCWLPIVNLRAVHGGGFATAARKKQRRRGAGVVEMDDEDDDDVGDEYDVDDEDDGGDDDDDDDDVEGMLPLEQMRKLFKKKPKGFGEGKVYDTSVEDKLLEEMRKSREAQGENLKKLKNNPLKPGFNKSDVKKKDAEVIPIGGRVRLANLPKKKNIHRDLKSALQGIPGILNIVPAVSGNKKTRDPVCRGFAFVDFRRKDDAVRFVELYSGQTITFGKVEKQMKCELLDAQSSSSTSLELSKKLDAAPHLMVSAFEKDSNEDYGMDDSALGFWDGTTSEDSDDLDNQINGEKQEGVGNTLKVDYDDSVETRIDSEINSLSSEQVNGNPTAEQNSSAGIKQEHARKKSKEKAKKVSKLDVPGSAKRLKIKEKAVLSDVFSKYGLKAALASKDS